MTLDLNCYHGFDGLRGRGLGFYNMPSVAKLCAHFAPFAVKIILNRRGRKGYAKFRKEKRCNPAISSCCTELHGLARIREIRGHSGYWSTSEKYQLNQVTIAGRVQMDILFK